MSNAANAVKLVEVVYMYCREGNPPWVVIVNHSDGPEVIAMCKWESRADEIATQARKLFWC